MLFISLLFVLIFECKTFRNTLKRPKMPGYGREEVRDFLHQK